MKTILRKIYRFWLASIYPNTPNTLRAVKSNGLIQLVWINEIVGQRIATNRYELAETQFFKSLIKPDDICLDIGSNIGYFTQLFASLSPEGYVVSIEANSKNCKLIDLNIDINEFGDRISLVNAAVSDENDVEIDFNTTTDSAYGFIQKENDRPIYSYVNFDGLSFQRKKLDKVRTKTIDTILTEHNITKVDVLKMDIEGYEFFAFKGMKTFLASKGSPRVMMVELVDEHLKYYNQSLKDVIEFVVAFGYKAMNLINGELIDYNSELNESNVVFLKNSQ